MLGHGHLEVSCFDGVKRIGHIRGKLRKKVSLGPKLNVNSEILGLDECW